MGAAGFRDVEVVRADNGAPGLVAVRPGRRVSVGRGVSRWHVSLTHTDTVAVAPWWPKARRDRDDGATP